MKLLEILLVEDNDGDILLTTEALKESGLDLSLHVVKDGLEAFNFLYKNGDYIQKPTPHLVLLDINLPKYNGFEVMKVLNEELSFKDIEVIVLSTSSAEEDILKSMENSVNCFLTKPVDVDGYNELIKKVKQIQIKKNRS